MIILLLAAIAGVAWFYVAAQRQRTDETTFGASTSSRVPVLDTVLNAPEHVAFTNEAIEHVTAESLKYAFGITQLEFHIEGDHAAVLEQISTAAETSMLQREYFPRRPMLLPKLMQALNDPETSREDLVKLILEDPAIAGGVLQQANTAFYRVSPARVDNIDRAVLLLGTDGLRRLMATAIMQPVFRLSKGHFDSFAPTTWEHAQRAAAAAEAYSMGRSECDPFVAQLLAVLEPLARIVIFRFAMEKYREAPKVQPRAEVFARAMQLHSSSVAVRIAEAWGMTDASMAAVREQAERVSPLAMRELSRAVYYARLTATLTLVAAREPNAAPELTRILRSQGLTRMETELLWQASVSSCA